MVSKTASKKGGQRIAPKKDVQNWVHKWCLGGPAQTQSEGQTQHGLLSA